MQVKINREVIPRAVAHAIGHEIAQKEWPNVESVKKPNASLASRTEINLLFLVLLKNFQIKIRAATE